MIKAMLARQGLVAITLCALSAMTAVSSVPAAPGDLDPTFSGDGMITTDLPRSWDYLKDVALQANGKIVVAGSTARSGAGSGSVFALARYHADGTLDRSFGGDGKVITGFTRRNAEAWGVAIQADGKIVAAGRAGSSFALVRYRPNGRLDPSFGGDGRVRTDFTLWLDFASELAIQPNGKIVAGGRAGRGGGRFAVARYRPNGRLDPTFAGDGKETTDFSPGNDYARALALQNDGKIVAAGVVLGGHELGRVALARYNPDGRLDWSFGGDGKVMTDFGEYDEWAEDVAIQSDGRIVVAGSAPRFLVARYEPDGTLDASFGGDGSVTPEFDPPHLGGAWAVAVQGDGRIVALADRDSEFVVVRFNTDGTHDSTFGGDGFATADFMNESWGVGGQALAIQPDGKIVAAGHLWGGYRRAALARFLAE